jgi:hypothetical protein
MARAADTEPEISEDEKDLDDMQKEPKAADPEEFFEGEHESEEDETSEENVTATRRRDLESRR